MALFNNTVDTDEPYYRVDVVGDEGLLVLSKYWKRGSQIFIQEDSDFYQETKDKFGNSWLDVTTSNYKVTYLNPNKDSKLTENLVLNVSEPDIKDVTVSNAEIKPAKRGRPSKDDSKE